MTVKTYDYDAFGNDRNELATDANPFRYCGEYFDTATETYFLRARWYDPATGRFTQQDSWAYYKPDDPLSLNLYLYCYGNPVGYVDPSGNASKKTLDQQNNIIYDVFRDPMAGGGGLNPYSFSGADPSVLPGGSYYNYLVRSNTARYDGGLGGYIHSGTSTSFDSLNRFYVSSTVSVYDDLS